ncbi:MAG: hypothetical protein D6776_10430 [Planctomycetota bacterium]|nr:MAG: hypothetical protein D6776_10430 [Planctomycetota bacterium]
MHARRPAPRPGRAAFIAAGALTLLTAVSATAYIRFVTSGGSGLYWSSNTIPYTIHAAGSDDVPGDDSESTAIRLAFARWEQIAGSNIHFAEDPSKANDPPASGLDGTSFVFFDETNATGLFTGASQVVALTTVMFDGAGRIVEADLVFNGRDHSFSTDLSPGTFDVQSIATHEIGHYLGLDHTGVYGATMNPYASLQDTKPRSLSRDEEAFARAVYPAAGASRSQIRGQVVWAGDGSGVGGAHVVALDLATGETAASAITDSGGNFTIDGLLGGDYRVYAEPLDGPTTAANVNVSPVETGFGTRFVGGNASPSTISVAAGGSVSVGTLSVSPPTSAFNLTGVSPRAVRRGQTVQLYLMGTGLASGQTVQLLGPGVTIVGGASPNEGTLGSGASFSVQIAADAPTGLRDIVVLRDTGSGLEAVALPGGLEIQAAAPRVDAVSPALGGATGGDTVTISGADFVDGATVLFGDQPASAVQWLDAGTLQASTPAGAVGTVDVIVINPDGQEARRTGGFQYTGDPILDTVDPDHGPLAGGVSLTLHGSQFVPGASVLIGDSAATSVSVAADGRTITCSTPAGVSAGPVDVVVVNPDGSSDTLAGGYTYAAPSLAALDPAAGSTSGGAYVALHGDNFAPGSTVYFGDNVATGLEFVSQYELRATAPAGPEGAVDVTVVTPDGAVATLPGGFTYVLATQPVIDSVSPSSGSTAGGTTIRILGSGFAAGAVVLVDGVTASNVVLVSQGEITAVTPPGSAGKVDVVVRNPSGLEAVGFDDFTYTTPSSGFGTSSGGGGGCSLAAGTDRLPAAAPWLLWVAVALALRWRLSRGRRIGARP